MNVVLLTIDAWRADFVDAWAGVRLVPALDRLGEHLVRYDRLYANGPWTSPALASVFTGHPPSAHGVVYEWSAPQVGPGLASVLKGRGFDAPNLCYLNELENYSRLGYDAADTPARPTGPDDPVLFEALASARPPFFHWYHYKYVHLPYWAAAPYRRMFGVVDVSPRLRASVGTGFVVPREEWDFSDVTPDEIEATRRLYAASVRQMSDWLERVIDALPERTVLVVTSDHGEELFDHGFVGHASTAHHAHLHEELLRIPLLVWHPDAAPARHDVRLQGADLYGMLLGLAGGALPAPPDVDPHRVFELHSARMGCPTPRELEGQVVSGTTDGRRKVIEERYEVPRRFAYDLLTDPEERHPLPA